MDVYSSRLRFFTDLLGKLISENINRRRFMDNSWSLVQILPPQPSCCNKIDDNAEKPELSGFFGVQMPKIL